MAWKHVPVFQIKKRNALYLSPLSSFEPITLLLFKANFSKALSLLWQRWLVALQMSNPSSNYGVWWLPRLYFQAFLHLGMAMLLILPMKQEQKLYVPSRQRL